MPNEHRSTVPVELREGLTEKPQNLKRPAPPPPPPAPPKKN